MTKQRNRRFKEKIQKIVAFALNPRLLLCFGIGWLFTNGWAYIMFGIGSFADIRWMVDISLAYLTVLWFPFTPEKLITVTIAIFLLKRLFPNDEKTLAVLKKWHRSIMEKKESRAKKADQDNERK